MSVALVLVISVASFAEAKYGHGGHHGPEHGHGHGYDDAGYGHHVGYHPAPAAVVAKIPAVAKAVVDYHVRWEALEFLII